MGSERQGRMRVLLTVHGGEQALTDVLEGLVQRNVRSIREGRVPPAPVQVSGLMPSPEPVWRDAVSAIADGAASRGTLAAWQAAGDRVRGIDSRIALVGGLPEVVHVNAQDHMVVSGLGGMGSVGAGVSGRYAPDEGKVDERMLLTIDDDYALPVREINTCIANHNARRIIKKGLPRLYKSGVYYENEGSPELWWDCEEILRNGHDDCEGLAAYRAGELIALENTPARVHTRFIQAPPSMGGGRIFHAVTEVDVPDSEKVGFIRHEYDDPSARLGMERPSWYMEFCRKLREQGKAL